jgi:hypothetical protein
VNFLGLGKCSVYDFNRSGYGLTHMLKSWDVPSDIQYNTSTTIRGGNHKCSLWEPQTFSVGTLKILGGNFECSWWELQTSLVQREHLVNFKSQKVLISN